VGAALFACLDPTSRRVPVEASIGVVYVVAMAATMLLSMNLPHGLEHAHALLSGSILWVTPKDLLVAAVLYGAVAILHLVFRRRFLQLSFARAEARAAGIAVRWWDFLFYAGFAVVVSSSVALAGVLLVFAYLVIPAAFAVLFAESVAVRLVLGWCMGAAVSILGLVASYHWDLPSGPCLVLALAVALALATMRSGRGSWAPGNRRKP
jgi:zinc/manganese transport system permease protein